MGNIAGNVFACDLNAHAGACLPDDFGLDEVGDKLSGVLVVVVRADFGERAALSGDVGLLLLDECVELRLGHCCIANLGDGALGHAAAAGRDEECSGKQDDRSKHESSHEIPLLRCIT